MTPHARGAGRDVERRAMPMRTPTYEGGTRSPHSRPAAPADGLSGLLLSLQRTAGNQAVNALLQRQVFKPRPAPQTPDATHGHAKSPAHAKSPVYDKAYWHTSVEKPLAAASAAIKKGPRHFTDAEKQLQRAQDAVDKIRLDGDWQASHHRGFQELNRVSDSISAVQNLLPAAGKRISYTKSSPKGALSSLVTEATFVGKSLAYNAKDQKTDDPAAVSQRWEEMVLSPLQAADTKLEQHPDMTGDDPVILRNELEEIWAAVTLIESLVEDHTFDDTITKAGCDGLKDSLTGAIAVVGTREHMKPDTDFIEGPLVQLLDTVAEVGHMFEHPETFEKE